MARFRCARRCNLRLPDRVGLAAMHFPCTPQNESLLTEKKRQGKSSFPLALQTVKKHLGGVGGAAAPLTFIRIRRLCRRGGWLILLAKSIPYKFGRPLVGRICFLTKVVKTTFVTRGSARGKAVSSGAFVLDEELFFHRGGRGHGTFAFSKPHKLLHQQKNPYA